MVDGRYFEFEGEEEFLFGDTSDSSSEANKVQNPDGRKGTWKCETCRQKKVKVSTGFVKLLRCSVRGVRTLFLAITVATKGSLVDLESFQGRIEALAHLRQGDFTPRIISFSI